MQNIMVKYQINWSFTNIYIFRISFNTEKMKLWGKKYGSMEKKYDTMEKKNYDTLPKNMKPWFTMEKLWYYVEKLWYYSKL